MLIISLPLCDSRPAVPTREGLGYCSNAGLFGIEPEAELEASLDAERLDRSTAVRKLLSEGLDPWRREQALDRFAEGDLSLARAAELADRSVWEFAELVEDADIAWISGDHLEVDLDEL